jgi:hypothetical protein
MFRSNQKQFGVFAMVASVGAWFTQGHSVVFSLCAYMELSRTNGNIIVPLTSSLKVILSKLGFASR